MRKVNKCIVTGVVAAMVLACSACGSGSDAPQTSQNKSNGQPNQVSETATQSAVSEDCMQKVYDALVASESSYSKLKEVDTATKYSESVDGDKLTISAEGEYTNGTWEFVLEGDYITSSFDSEDMFGPGMFIYVCQAVGDYLGMDENLMNGYIKAVGVKDMTKDYITTEEDESSKKTNCKIYVGEPYVFDEMNSWYIDSDVLADTEELGDESVNHILGIGKVTMFAIGSKDSFDIFMAEYGGESTELTYKSLIEAAKVLKPDGYEKFVEGYTGLAEEDTDDYQVTFPTQKDDIPEAFQELGDDYKFVKAHFGADSE